MAGKKRKPGPKQTARGRPSKYRPEFAEQAAKLCALGAIDADLAEFFKVHEDTITEWKSAHPEFSVSIKEAKEIADRRVERSLYERANGFEHPDLYIAQYQGTVIKEEIRKKYPPDTAAAIFWLKNRQPAKWREKVEHEVGGPGGGPIVYRVSKPDEDL